MTASTGELAMTVDLAQGFAMTQLFALADPKGADAAIGKIVHLFDAGKTYEVMDMPSTLKTTPNVPAYDNVALRGYDLTYDFSKLPAAKQAQMQKLFPAVIHTRVGVVDGNGMFVNGSNADVAAHAMIDAARGKGSHFTPPAQVADLLRASRSRHDSIALVMDFAAIISAVRQTAAIPGASIPGVMTLGFADKRAHLRVAASVATIKSIAHL
jgi:hypothetical protein